jgi:large subunit ribosomal protein L25
MELVAHNREILGKKVKTLRRQGITPVHLFGNQVEPLPLQCDTAQLQRTLVQIGMTGIISLKLDKARKTRNVMVREVQRAPRTGDLLHVDFYQIRMDEKLKVDVPVVTVGEAPALRMKEYYLSHELNNLSIECLPDEIPAKIEIDVSGLEEADQAIHVADIDLGEGVTILTHPEQLVVKIATRFIEKEEEVEAGAAEGEAEAGAEGAPAAEEQSGGESQEG